MQSKFQKMKDWVHSKIRSTLTGWAGQMANKLSSLGGKIYVKMETWLDQQWYFEGVTPQYKKNLKANFRIWLSKFLLKLSSGAFSVILKVAAKVGTPIHQVPGHYLQLPGPIPGCDPSRPFLYPAGWTPPMSAATNQSATAFLQMSDKERRGLKGKLNNLGGAMKKASGNALKHLIGQFAALLPLPDVDISFPKRCLVPDGTQPTPPPPPREDVSDARYMNYDEAKSTCVTRTVEGQKDGHELLDSLGRVGGMWRAEAACPEGFTMLSGGMSIEKKTDKVSTSTTISAPSRHRKDAWECGLNPGVAFQCHVRCCQYADARAHGMLRNRATSECMHPEVNTGGLVMADKPLTSSISCGSDAFRVLRNGAIQHLASKLCLIVQYVKLGGTPVKLSADCQSKDTIFEDNGHGVLRHFATGKCLQVLPVDGEYKQATLGIKEGCTGLAATWDFIQKVSLPPLLALA